MEVTGDTISAIAMEYVGYGYAWGGSSPGVGFDCSGFIGYVCQEAGVPVPNHDLYGQLNAGPSIEMEQLQPGDLVFFQNTYTAGLSHGGIYIGGGQFVHAVDDGVGVKVTNIGDQYWASRFVGASRPAAVGSR
jgi:cell wall-associated NlpC family hydrolase